MKANALILMIIIFVFFRDFSSVFQKNLELVWPVCICPINLTNLINMQFPERFDSHGMYQVV